MDELTAFVSARLDEDEAAAKAACGATGGQWIVTDEGRIVRHADTPGNAPVAGGLWDLLKYAHVAHIARHDPARVLREVAAKRAIVEMHARPQIHSCAPKVTKVTWTSFSYLDPCPTLRLLAAVWSDHPDYHAEWAV